MSAGYYHVARELVFWVSANLEKYNYVSNVLRLVS